ncbi:MAG: single-stranded DNA-binding protein [Firmicutes bacterium]|nr:single-stranded DNA-binding protein [Bacillota bacterium]
MNKVILMGRLTRDPEVRYTQGNPGTAVGRYSLAVSRPFKRDGEPEADFFNIVAFGNRGEFAGKYFRKGMQVAIVGELRNNSYTDRDGHKRITTDIIATEQYFAESRSQNQQNNQPTVNSDFAPAGAGYQTPGYTGAVKPPVRRTGNRKSGPEETGIYAAEPPSRRNSFPGWGRQLIDCIIRSMQDPVRILLSWSGSW